MKVHEHFNLRVAPFERRPEPGFYFAAPAHAEALATLQYAFQSYKRCCMVVGESGSGKTLIGRLLANYANPKASILWVPGTGQPREHIDAHVWPLGSLKRGEVARRKALEVPLAQWRHMPLSQAAPTLVIVDDADCLPDHGWDEILALVSRDFHTARPTMLTLLGLPRLTDSLSGPKLIRLRRRVFRLCHLDRLPADTTRTYIRHRIAKAGGRRNPFTKDAIQFIHRLTGGNPALVNQVCDNAMVDAFGDERTTITSAHVIDTVRGITGATSKEYALARPALRRLHLCSGSPGRTGTELSTVIENSTPSWEDVVPGTPIEQITESRKTVDQRDQKVPSLLPEQIGETSAIPVATEVTITETTPVVQSKAPATTSPETGARLRRLEQRISSALGRIREARSQRVTQVEPEAQPEIEVSPEQAETRNVTVPSFTESVTN